MKQLRSLTSGFIATLALLTVVSTVQAQEIPQFPACPNPGGALIAQYDSGVHGVPGNPAEFGGSDKVFKLNDAMIVQCLCPPSGSGVQTLWWKDPGLSSQQTTNVLAQGWIKVPNGALWGLSEGAYFAKSSNFSCGGGSVNGASTSGGDAGSIGGVTTTVGKILGATTYAATGNTNIPVLLAALALILLVISQAIKSIKLHK